VIGEWLAVLEASAAVTALRNSVWVYPLVNAAHLLGVALLVGAMVPLDLRLLGVWRRVALEPLWRVLTRSAALGLVLAMAAGALLFVTRAGEYAASPVFRLKMLVVAVGVGNALALRVAPPAMNSTRLRLAAALSLAAWLLALLLGRSIGYF